MAVTVFSVQGGFTVLLAAVIYSSEIQLLAFRIHSQEL